jgi:hypothetical protein
MEASSDPWHDFCNEYGLNLILVSFDSWALLVGIV